MVNPNVNQMLKTLRTSQTLGAELNFSSQVLAVLIRLQITFLKPHLQQSSVTALNCTQISLDYCWLCLSYNGGSSVFLKPRPVSQTNE